MNSPFRAPQWLRVAVDGRAGLPTLQTAELAACGHKSLTPRQAPRQAAPRVRADQCVLSRPTAVSLPCVLLRVLLWFLEKRERKQKQELGHRGRGQAPLSAIESGELPHHTALKG